MAGLPRDLIGQLRAAGAEHVQEAAPEVVDLDVLRSWCDREERILRYQYDGGKFADRYEDELASLPLTDTTNALRRWALIKHLYRIRSENLQAEPVAAPADKQTAADLLLRREPVPVRIGDRVIKVTGRSYSAMAAMAAEATAIEQLEADLQLVTTTLAKLVDERATAPLLAFGQRNALRRRARSLHGLATRVVTEIKWHRMALYAHAMTESGAPARDIQAEVPEWWDQVGPIEDAALLAALWEAGPGRYHTLGPSPRPQWKKREGAQRSENFGWPSLFAVWEPKLKLGGAPLEDCDLGQLLVKLRAQAIDQPELES